MLRSAFLFSRFKELISGYLVVLADAGYFTASDIAKCLTNGITPHVSNGYENVDSITMCVPCSEKESAEANEPSEFTNKGKNVYFSENNVGICHMGKILYPTKYSKSRKTAQYTNKDACKNCPRRNECGEYGKKMERRIPEAEFLTEHSVKGLNFKQIVYSADKNLLEKRKTIVEHPYGAIKRSMDSSYCLLKGKEKVTAEFALTFLAYNLKRAINILGATKLIAKIAE